MFQTILVSLDICFLHMFFGYIENLQLQVLMEKMLHEVHMLYRTVPEQDLERDGQCIEDVDDILVILELIERDADDVVVRISLLRDIHREIIRRSSVHERIFLIADYRKDAGDRHAAEKDGYDIALIEEKEFSCIDVRGSDIDFRFEARDILGQVLPELLFEEIELEQ